MPSGFHYYYYTIIICDLYPRFITALCKLPPRYSYSRVFRLYFKTSLNSLPLFFSYYLFISFSFFPSANIPSYIAYKKKEQRKN